jgi:hypothetical protein
MIQAFSEVMEITRGSELKVELEDVIESLQFHDQSLMDEELLFKMVS